MCILFGKYLLGRVLSLPHIIIEKVSKLGTLTFFKKRKMSGSSTLLDSFVKSFFTSNQQIMCNTKGGYILLQNSVNVLLFKGLVFVAFLHS